MRLVKIWAIEIPDYGSFRLINSENSCLSESLDRLQEMGSGLAYNVAQALKDTNRPCDITNLGISRELDKVSLPYIVEVR